MWYADFLSGLFEDGRVIVPAKLELSEEEQREADELLTSYEAVHRLSLPTRAPEFDIAAAHWAGKQIFHACQFIAYRDHGVEAIHATLQADLGMVRTPGVIYSVDVLFRYLPDLIKLARSESERDPLLDCLNRWAAEWPLSSVGLLGFSEGCIDGIVEHRSLMQLYVDRIIANVDESRLSDPRVRDEVRASIGMHSELSSRLSDLLRKFDTEEATP